MIRIVNLRVSYGRNQVLGPVNMDVKRSSIIIGQNGSGKTTLIKSICGIVKVHGEIRFELEKENNGNMDVVSNVEEIFSFATNPRDISLLFSEYSSMDSGKFRECLDTFGMHSLYEKNFKEMSTGEQKIAFTCLALSAEATITFLDEPFENLDPRRRKIMMNQILQFQSTAVMVTHELEILRNFEEWDIYILSDGTIFGPILARDFLNSMPVPGKSGDSLITVYSAGTAVSFIPSRDSQVGSYRNLDEIFGELY